MERLESILLGQPLFRGLEARLGAVVGDCARTAYFPRGLEILREGDPADEFYLLEQGRVSLEVHEPGRQAVVFSTLGCGALLGASWLVPPYRWTFDARAIDTVRAIGIDARRLRAECEADHALGYELIKRVAAALIQRLHATRLQMLDLYGSRLP
jgi:CRP/FNR family transcriptional regulator, cyclic AMP receptor protein